MADLHSNIFNARLPRLNFLHVHAVFIIGMVPAPWEILDPPLLIIDCQSQIKQNEAVYIIFSLYISVCFSLNTWIGCFKCIFLKYNLKQITKISNSARIMFYWTHFSWPCVNLLETILNPNLRRVTLHLRFPVSGFCNCNHSYFFQYKQVVKLLKSRRIYVQVKLQFFYCITCETFSSCTHKFTYD